MNFVCAAVILAMSTGTVTVASQPERGYRGPDAVESREAAGPMEREQASRPAPSREPELPPPAPGDGDDEPLPEYDPLQNSPEAIRARHWLRGGIVLTASGTLLAIGGILMGTLVPDACKGDEAEMDPSGNSCQEEARERAALTMAVPGVAMVIGGVSMLAVGGERLRRLKAGLSATRDSAAVVFSGKF